ncbi:hypothetical protein OSB04_029175 [Centaurea solstitialis]|uniref:Uncharacterized protein n=1 Tax=Centaurea solstitialis TaxID=347529 RepID=A0AA38SH30_9ASTR|nr:hypothetical protein OSB04_029175 [Centaurea solstitialis]
MWHKLPLNSCTQSNTIPVIAGKACHLPFEFEHKALWALKKVYLDDITSGRERLLNLHELEELRSLAYKNSKIYKEQCKKWHDVQLKKIKIFKEGDKVLLYQTRFKFSLGKLKSRWVGPFVVLKAHPSGYVDLIIEKGQFRVNGQRLKLYHSDDQSEMVRSEESIQSAFAIAKIYFRAATENDKIVGEGVIKLANAKFIAKFSLSFLLFLSEVALGFCVFMASKDLEAVEWKSTKKARKREKCTKSTQ